MGIRKFLSSVSGEAVTCELQSYGLDVIQDDLTHCRDVYVKAALAFIDHYRIADDTPIVRTDTLGNPASFEDAIDVQFNWLVSTGWVFTSGEAVTAEAAVARLAQRLCEGHAVTVTSQTAPILERALASGKLTKLSAWQRLVLRAIAWFTARTGRPVLVAIRPRCGLHATIGWRSAGHLFASVKIRRVQWWWFVWRAARHLFKRFRRGRMR